MAELHEFFASMSPEAEWKEPDDVTILAHLVPEPPPTTRFTPSGQTNTFSPSAVDLGDPATLSHVTFWLVNGWQIEDGLSTCVEGNAKSGRIEFKLGDWAVRIEPRGDIPAKDLRKHGRETGLSNVTHIGRISRVDGNPFNASDIGDVLDVIEVGASFATGRVTAVLLPVGWSKGAAQWARWQADRSVDRPTTVMSWLDPYVGGEQLIELFERLWDTKTDPLRWTVLLRSLGYYFSGQHEATVTMTVLLPVSALLMFAFAYFTEIVPADHPSSRSTSKWKELSTESAIRLLLEDVGVDLAVPEHFSHFLGARKTMGRSDALSTIISMRNDVAHPTSNRLNKWEDLQWAEAGFSAMGYFDAVLLWWVGFTGRYIPRDAKYRGLDSSIKVPWAS